MPARPALARVLLLLVLTGVVTTAAVTVAQTPQGQTVFRGSTVLVPVDVRVLDKKGKPITDLKAEDFTVTEDGVRQDVVHFSTQALSAGAPTDGGPLRRSSGATTTLAPQNRRLFLIVLGRGRLEEVSKGMQALLGFVSTRLMPQDQVALMAWNRATDFTTDHAQIRSVLERFRAKHRDIEFDLQIAFGGLAGLYAGRQIPHAIQQKIDAVFNGPDGAASRQVLPSAKTSQAEADAQRIGVRKSEIEARNEMYRQFGGTDRALSDLMAGDITGENFDEYVAMNRQTMQDVGNLYAGIDYLRFIEGEKHLVFVTEQGIMLPRADYDRDIGALASDARVAIDTIQTGGVAVTMVAGMPVVPNGFALSALRTVSEVSGGQVSVSNYGDAAINQIVNSTEFGYLLGYTSSNPALDNRFRKIKIEVKRSGSTVSYRHGYFARSEADSFDPRQSLATTRMVAALNYRDDIQDLKVGIKVANVKLGINRVVNVAATVATNRVKFALVDGRYVAAISYAIICTDERGQNVGELWKTSDIGVAVGGFPEVQQNGLKWDIQVPVRMPAAFVKIIVYDYGSDLVGTTQVRAR